MNADVRAQVEAVRRNVGVWIREDHTFVRLTGKDAASWLHTQTTNDVKSLQSGQGQANAVLDRKGRLKAHFTLHRWEDELWVLVERQQAPHLLETLDAHLFLEDAQMTDVGAEVEQVVVQGPQSLRLLATLCEGNAVEALPRHPYGCAPVTIAGHQLLAFRLSTTGEDGYVLAAEAGHGEALIRELLAAGAGGAVITPEAREVLRIEAGIPRFGIDMDSNYRIPETTLEREAVSYDKGCYIGQEVVARLKAYGSVKQAVMGLIVEEPDDAALALPVPGAALSVDGVKVGHLASSTFSPTLGRTIAMAYLDRTHRTPGARLRFEAEGGAPFTGRIVVLPFYEAPSREERARALYDRSLELFQRDIHDEDDTVIGLLQEAVLLAPEFEDAYEVLGVILNRHGRVDEAIHYMQILASLNPECIMAHTNLSVFYVSKGMIEEAETEKAKAAVLQIKKASEARKAEEIAAAERERIRQEAIERIGMFREVLEIDPDDSLATFGMGTAHMQLNEYSDAVPYLKRATEITKDYSAAYLNLGKCLEFLGRYEEAVQAYRQGIEAATRKGDLMPMREMERRLKGLEQAQPAP